MAGLLAAPHGDGQITIFAMSTCRHCAKAKTFLREKAWAFHEISLELYPEMKTAMLQLSDRLTIPQIFFNETHVGGTRDLELMAQNGQLDALYESMRGTSPPSDPRYHRPERDPVPQKKVPALTETDLCIGGLLTSYASVYATITGARDNVDVSSAPASSTTPFLRKKEKPGAMSDLGCSELKAEGDGCNEVSSALPRANGSSGGETLSVISSGGSTGDSDDGRLCNDQRCGESATEDGGNKSNSSSASASTNSSASGSSQDESSGSEGERDQHSSSSEGEKSSSLDSSYINSPSAASAARDDKKNNKKGMMVLDIRDRKYYLQTYRRCFFGSQLVDVLIDRYDLRGGREEGRQVAEMLFEARMFHHVTNEQAFEDSTKFFYRMTADEEPLVLNTWRVWNDRVDNDSLAILDRCSKFLDRILRKHRNEEGLVAYDAVAEDEAFAQFEEMSCEIQAVDLAKLPPDSRIAFSLNVYNMMVKHAFAKLGRPETTMKRDAFFSNVSYNIGGLVYSLNEIENGVLRGNKRPPGFHLSKPFGSGDARLAAVLTAPDPRIHFALNCGAKSCPPVKTYTAENVREELRVVALAFCEQDSNVHIDVEAKTLSTSRIFYWYGNDFGASTDEVLARIGRSWLRGKRKVIWETMLKTGRYRHRKLNYDWTTDALPSGRVFQGVPRGK